MAKSKSPLATIIILALAVVLLFALNPTMADFQAWRSGQAKAQAGSGNGVIGMMKKGAGAIAGAMTGFVSGAYERGDYLIFSTYSLGGSKGDLYLGLARLFIKLR
jgi:hypothetical protein